MSAIIGISVVLISISTGLAYLSYKFVNTEEVEIINEIQAKYPNANYY